jgi:transposase
LSYLGVHGTWSQRKEDAMRIISKRCLGLDLHKKQITAHLRVHRGSDQLPKGEDLRFGTMPDELQRLRQWIIDQKVEDVVMESTSVYWMHLYELIEEVTKPLVANASHVKKVPGRKTDVGDAQWLAELGAHGLLRPSFVPPKEIRALRSVARYRTRCVAMQTAVRNRTIKLLEMAGIKLSSVVSDCFGVTGRAILDALTTDKPVDVVKLAKMSLRKKTDELDRCLGKGLLSALQRRLLKMHFETYDAIDAQIAQSEAELDTLSAPYSKAIEALDAIPGINRLGAITLIAETGVDMTAYRNDAHLTALAGLAPGNAISADKRRRISVRKGNYHLKRICVQFAWAASRKKNSFLRIRFLRLQNRIGRNKAVVAVARQMLVLVYHVLSGKPYTDLGPTFYDQRDKARAVDRYAQKLAALGYTVQLVKKQP